MTDIAHPPSADASTIESASREARETLSTIVSSLNASPAANGPGTFFPNGIELIFVKIELGITEKTKASVEIRIAGEKGVSGTPETVAADEPAMESAV